MSGEETIGPDAEEITAEIAHAIAHGWTIYVVGFDHLHVQEFTVGIVEAMETDGVEIDYREPGSEYVVVTSGAEISAVAMIESKYRRIREAKPVLALVLAGEQWPAGTEDMAIKTFRSLVDLHPAHGTVIGRVP